MYYNYESFKDLYILTEVLGQNIQSLNQNRTSNRPVRFVFVFKFCISTEYILNLKTESFYAHLPIFLGKTGWDRLVLPSWDTNFSEWVVNFKVQNEINHHGCIKFSWRAEIKQPKDINSFQIVIPCSTTAKLLLDGGKIKQPKDINSSQLVNSCSTAAKRTLEGAPWLVNRYSIKKQRCVCTLHEHRHEHMPSEGEREEIEQPKYIKKLTSPQPLPRKPYCSYAGTACITHAHACADIHNTNTKNGVPHGPSKTKTARQGTRRAAPKC